MQPVPKPVAVARAQATGKFKRKRPVTGAHEVFTQLNFIRRENADAAPPARNGDIPLLGVGSRLDGGIGKEDVIHRFALRTVGRDGVAGQKFTKAFVQDTSIGKLNSPVGTDGLDRKSTR